MANILPQGPLSAYLGVRNQNMEADLEGIGLLAKLQQIDEARKFRELQLRQLAADKEAQRDLQRELTLARTTSAENIAGENRLSREGIASIQAGSREAIAATRPERPIAVLKDGKPVYVKQSEALGQTPYSPSIAGGGLLAPETLTFTARQYLAGDRQAVQGYARNATARIALQNAIVNEAQKQGLSPEQTAAKMADFAGVLAGSRTVGQRAANISLAATEAQEMLGIVKETSDKFSRTQFVPWNMALRAYETGTGSPEIAEFGAAVNALVNVYARAINPTGVPTVSDKEHARAVLNTIQSQAQVEGVLKIINRELEVAKKAPGTVRKATMKSIAPSTPTPPDAAGAFDDPEKERRYQEWKARQK